MIRPLTVLTLNLVAGVTAFAQQLEPRAYSTSPTGVNMAILAYGYSAGDLNFDPSLPVDNASARINSIAIAYFRSINALGRSANVTVALPYTFGHLQGDYLGVFLPIYRSGMSDISVRFAINLYGARAMQLKEFASYRQRTNIGASIAVSAPTGQYDPAKLINIGANRWALKPEVGVSHAFRNTRWILDAYAGAWLYTPNNNLNGLRRTQSPIASAQFHLSYDFGRRLWAAFDANLFRGGRTALNGVKRNDLQTNSRVGGTISVPLTRRQSVKFAYARGAYTTIGGDFQTFSFSYQYLWGGGM
jgi:hypothetical protein